MSNTNTDYLYPEFWANAFDEMDKGQYQLQNLVSKNYDSQLATKGDTVNVPLTPDMTAADWTPGSSISATGITQTTAQLILDKSKKVTINLTAAELTKSNYDLISSYGVPMAQAVLESVNSEIYKEMLKSTYFVNPGTPGSTSIDEDDIIDVGKLLDENKVGRNNRFLVVSPADAAVLLKLDAFQYANYSGDAGKAMTTGSLGSKFGFNIFVNNAISDYTMGDTTGAVNLLAGYAASTTTMIVDAFNDDSAPIRAGDIFKTSTGATYYSVTATETTSSDTTSITFGYNGSGLVASAADNEVLTFSVTRSALGFVPSGIALAARPYASLPAGAGALTSVSSLDGIPVRFSVWHDGNLGLNIQADILFGVKLINQKRVCRILC
jgi:hypothetical protein